MTDDKIAPGDLLEKGSDATFVRKMIVLTDSLTRAAIYLGHTDSLRSHAALAAEARDRLAERGLCWQADHYLGDSTALEGAAAATLDHPLHCHAASGQSCEQAVRRGSQPAISSLIRLAKASIANGLVSTCIRGSRCPLPIAAFSA
jgi:hypothetical protein